MRFRLATTVLPFFAFAALASLSGCGKRAVKQPVPDPVTLMRKVIDANQQPGPYTITIDKVMKRKGQSLTLHGTVQWNDASHYRVTTTATGKTANGNRILGVANGSTRAVYSSAKNTYERGGGSNMLQASQFHAVLVYWRSRLDDPEAQEETATYIVTPTTFEGKPVYRLFAGPSEDGKGTYFAMLVDRDTMLVRKFVLHSDQTRSSTEVFTHTKEARPFPPETFELKPPAGARDITRSPDGS